MISFKNSLFAIAFTISACQSVFAQEIDYIGYVEQLSEQLRQESNMHARNAINSYRQETGDWNTPDQQVLNYLMAESQRQNPAFYQQLRQRAGTRKAAGVGRDCALDRPRPARIRSGRGRTGADARRGA